MKPKLHSTSTLAALCAAAALLVELNVSANIAGPYTNDVNTLHLWHLDESAVPAIDAVANPPGTNCINLANGAALGSNAFSGFGTALSTGTDDSATATRSQFLTPLPGNPNSSSGPFTFANASNKAFTFEALVWIGFDPLKNLGTTADGGNNRNAPCQIMSMEGGSGTRIFQFRIAQAGTRPGGTGNPTVKLVPYLTFENITAGQPTVFADIPTNGPDAILINNWYHVAVSYSGVPNTANNLKFYWTLLDPSRAGANQLAITSAQKTSSGPTIATTTTGSFEIGNQARNNNGNFLGLIDEVRMSSIERGPGDMMFFAQTVHITTQPTNQLVAAGDNVSLTVGATGQAIHYQWQFNDVNISPVLNSTATNATLVLTNITLGQAGSYRVVVTNSAPSSDISVEAVVSVGHVFAETFNTGLSDSRTLLSGGDIDPHWVLSSSEDPNFPAPPDRAAVVAGSVPGTYLANGPNSMWLAPVANISAAGGNYIYRTSFLLDTLDPAHAVLSAAWAMDNAGVEVHLNGVTNAITALGFANFTPFTLTNGFVPGLNTLECVITNFASGGNNPTGFRMELRGVALDLPATAPYVTTFPLNVITQSQQSASFSVATVGSTPLTYQWYHGATLLAGQTRRTLVLSGLSTADAGTYSVYVTNNVSFTNASAVLTVLSPPALAWVGNDPSSPAVWDNGVSTNWLDTGASANVTFAPLDDVLFDSGGSAAPFVNLVEAVSPNSVTVDAATDYTFTGAGSLAGNAVLTKKNTGTLVLDTANTYSGTTVIQAGTLQVGNADFSGTLGSSTVNNNAALVFNRNDRFVVPNSISGTGSVTMAGSGIAVLGGNSTYTGPTLVSSGTLDVNNVSALGDTVSGTTVAAGAQLLIEANSNVGAEPVTLNGFGFPTPAEGALRKVGGGGSGTLFGGPITLATDAGIKLDTLSVLNFTHPAGITGTNVNLAVQCDGTSVATVSGPISLGSGGLTEFGTGTWVLLGTNSDWSGVTTINSGATLQIGNGGTNGSLGGSSIQNSGTLTFQSANLIVTNLLSGGGALNHNGNSVLTFPNDNSSFSGTVTIRGSSVIRASANNALGGGTCTIGTAQADTARLELTGGIILPNAGAIFPRAFYGVVPASALNVAPQILNVSGNNTLSSTSSLLVGGGGDALVLQADAGTLTLAGGVTASAGTGRKLALRGVAAGEIQGILDHTGANSLNIYKLDSGTWTLSGLNNTPAGPTTVSNGVLVVSGSLDTPSVTLAGGTLSLSANGVLTNASPINVLAGATLNASGRTDGTLTVYSNELLMGNGTITGSLFVQGTLTPGASVGKLSVSGAASFDTTARTVMEVNNAAATNDVLSAGGLITYGGTLTITNISATAYTNNQVLKLFSGGSYGGSFSSIAFPGAAVYDASRLTVDGTVKLTTALSTNRPTMTFGVTGGNTLSVGWPLDHTTWRLLGQTNAPGAGINTNAAAWFQVPGSSSTNQVFLPIDHTTGSVFYRLVYP